MDDNTLDGDFDDDGPPQDTFVADNYEKTLEIRNFDENREDVSMGAGSNTFQPLFQSLEKERKAAKKREMREMPPPPPNIELVEEHPNTQILDDFEEDDGIEESPLIGDEDDETEGNPPKQIEGKEKQGKVSGSKRKRNDEMRNVDSKIEPKKKKSKLSHIRPKPPLSRTTNSRKTIQEPPVGPSKEMAKLLGLDKKRKKKLKSKSPKKKTTKPQPQQNTPGRGLVNISHGASSPPSLITSDHEGKKKGGGGGVFSFNTLAFEGQHEPTTSTPKKKKNKTPIKQKRKNNKLSSESTSSSDEESDGEFSKRQKEFERRSSRKREKEEEKRKKKEELEKRKLEKRKRRKLGKEQKRKQKEEKMLKKRKKSTPSKKTIVVNKKKKKSRKRKYDDDEEEEEPQQQKRGRGGKKNKRITSRRRRRKVGDDEEEEEFSEEEDRSRKKKKKRKKIVKVRKRRFVSKKKKKRRRGGKGDDDEDDEVFDNTYDYNDGFIDDDDDEDEEEEQQQRRRRSKKDDDDESYEYETQAHPLIDSTLNQGGGKYSDEEDEEEILEDEDDETEDEEEEIELFKPRKQRRKKKKSALDLDIYPKGKSSNFNTSDSGSENNNASNSNKKPSASRLLQQMITNIEKQGGRTAPMEKRKRERVVENDDLNSQVVGTDLLLGDVNIESHLFTIPRSLVQKIMSDDSSNLSASNENNKKKKKKKKSRKKKRSADDEDEDDDEGLIWPLQFMITEISKEKRNEITMSIRKHGGRVLESTDLSGQFSHNLILITDKPKNGRKNLRRTHKTLVSMMFHTPIISSEWISKCVQLERLIFPIPKQFVFSRSMLSSQRIGMGQGQGGAAENIPNMESLLQLRNHRILEGVTVKMLPGLNNSGSVGVWVKCLIQCGAKVVKKSKKKQMSKTEQDNSIRDEDEPENSQRNDGIDLLFFLDGPHYEAYRAGEADPYPGLPSIGPDHLVRCMFNDINMVYSTQKARMTGDGLCMVNYECGLEKSRRENNPQNILVGEDIKNANNSYSKKKKIEPLKIRIGDVIEYLTYRTPNPSDDGQLGMVMRTGLVRASQRQNPSLIMLQLMEFVEYNFPEYKLNQDGPLMRIDPRSVVRKVKLFPYKCGKSHGRYCTSYVKKRSVIKRESEEKKVKFEEREESHSMKTKWNHPKSRLARHWFQENPEVSQQAKFYSYLIIDGCQYFINQWVRMKCVTNSVELSEVYGRIVEMIGDDVEPDELDHEENKFISTLSSSESEEEEEEFSDDESSRRRRKPKKNFRSPRGMKLLFQCAVVDGHDEYGRVKLKLVKSGDPLTINLENVFEIESLRFGFQNDTVVPPPPPQQQQLQSLGNQQVQNIVPPPLLPSSRFYYSNRVFTTNDRNDQGSEQEHNDMYEPNGFDQVTSNEDPKNGGNITIRPSQRRTHNVSQK